MVEGEVLAPDLPGIGSELEAQYVEKYRA
jgi:L-alanine-DL-glutamate epimerase-like enolase superfamily enzyme